MASSKLWLPFLCSSCKRGPHSLFSGNFPLKSFAQLNGLSCSQVGFETLFMSPDLPKHACAFRMSSYWTDTAGCWSFSPEVLPLSRSCESCSHWVLQSEELKTKTLINIAHLHLTGTLFSLPVHIAALSLDAIVKVPSLSHVQKCTPSEIQTLGIADGNTKWWNGVPAMETWTVMPQTLKHRMTIWSSHSTRTLELGTRTDTWTSVFTGALFTMAKMGK